MEGGPVEQLWKSGREGSLCPLEQLRALAFRDVYNALHMGLYPFVPGQTSPAHGFVPVCTRTPISHTRVCNRLYLENPLPHMGFYPFVPGRLSPTHGFVPVCTRKALSHT